jgi:hypothetical protein
MTSDAEELRLTRLKFHPRQKQAFESEMTEMLFGGASEGGKLLDLATEVATPSGWATVGELKIGDKIFGQDGKLYDILDLSPINYEPKSYELTFDNGEKVIACADHLWKTFNRDERVQATRLSPEFRALRRSKRRSRAIANPNRTPSQIEGIIRANKTRTHNYKPIPTGTVRTTQEIFDTLRVSTGHINHSIRLTKPLELEAKELPIDPYLLGAWLGDGHSNAGRLTGRDPEVWEEFEKAGFKVTHRCDNLEHGLLGFIHHLRAANVLNNKHIPADYLRGSKEQRLALLQGLMDTDGCCDKDGSVQFTNTNKNLSDGVAELAASLGWKVFRRSKIPTIYGKPCARAYIVKFSPDEPIFRIKRKIARQKLSKRKYNEFYYITDCQPIASRPMRCIRISNPEKLFLITKSFIATHNSAFIRRALARWCIHIPNLQCTLIRKKHSDILKNHVFGDDGFKVLLKDLEERKLVSITKDGVKFWNGSVINFQHCQDERQFDTAQGSGTHVLAIDEATQLSPRLINAFRGWCRMSKEMQAELPKRYQGKFPRIIYTANPIGASIGYFRREFVKTRAAFEIEKVLGFKRGFIPSRIDDNPSADKEAQAGRLAAFDKGTAKALIDGDWDAPTGDFFKNYDEAKHVVPDFIPPTYWLKWRSFDWGKSEPFSVLWFCLSDGEAFTDNQGRERWFPAGSVIVYREWHGCNPDSPEHGLGITNIEICRGILARTTENTSGITVTDSLPFQSRDDELMADVYAKHGVPLTKGNTDRALGAARVKDYLDGIDGYPRLYITESCKYLRDYLPAVETDPLDREKYVDSGEATHNVDALRYGIATRPTIKTKPAVVSNLVARINPSANISTSPKSLLASLNKKSIGNVGRR